jgi:hypothetical protein
VWSFQCCELTKQQLLCIMLLLYFVLKCKAAATVCLKSGVHCACPFKPQLLADCVLCRAVPCCAVLFRCLSASHIPTECWTRGWWVAGSSSSSSSSGGRLC